MEGLGDRGKNGCGDNEKKEMRKGGYVSIRHVGRGKPGICSDGDINFNSCSKPQRTHEESVEGKEGPQAWDWECISPLFRLGSRNQAFQNSIHWRDYCVPERGKLDDNAATRGAWRTLR